MMKKMMPAFLATLALVMTATSTHVANAGQPSHATGAWGWLGVGPRVVNEGFVGGSGNCDCSGLGAVLCPSATGRTCSTYYNGCSEGTTKLCTSGGTYTQCSNSACTTVPSQYFCDRSCG